ncbi:MAG TPA: hypothetical protein DEO84_06085 [candidate division Zixibacteria bacterium]|jgi:uncharacterized damage-inducible protein DinB|nr:hypothetical protein [candidate division Zixibacteria bacterium]HBZ00876.1 hypothetical protein [candidate division Zixibacteria bacterium]
MPKQMEAKPDTTMMWKDEFLRVWEQEYQTTLKVLKAYPEDKGDLRPHEKLRTARELVWGFTNGETWMLNGIMSGNFMGGERVDPPSTMREIIDNFEKVHSDAIMKVRRMNQSDLNKMVNFFIGPGKLGNVKVTDLLGMMVMDQIHHRGQMSVYLRIAGGKVPSIYGPTADEPWM